MSQNLFNDIGNHFECEYGADTSKMFGKPCIKINKKAFAVLFNNDMVFKLGKQEVEVLKDKYPEAVNWDPSGKKRAMKDWFGYKSPLNIMRIGKSY